MDITLQCDVSLSKKLRQVVGANARLSLLVDSLQGGRGEGRLLATIDGNEIDLSEIIGKETSIIITPKEILEEVPGSGPAVTNIFAPGANLNWGQRTPISRLAATTAPNNVDETAHSFVVKQEVKTPNAFKELDDPSAKSYISNLEELLEAVSKSLHKVSDVNLDHITNPRQKAVAMENRERSLSVGIPAFVVNVYCNSLSINDLNISLQLNLPYNLGNISAKRLSESADLKAMLRAGYVKFIEPKDVQMYINKAAKGEAITTGLDVYDNHRQAEAAIETSVPDGDEMEISVNEIDDVTEQQRLATNLTPFSPTMEDGGVRRSVHGGRMSAGPRTVGNAPAVNKAGLKTISRAK